MSAERRDSIVRQQSAAPLVAAVNSPFPEICAGWLGLRDAGDAARAPVNADVPVLAFAGTLDGRTPLAQVRDVLSHLSRSHLVEVENIAHSDVAILRGAGAESFGLSLSA